MNYRRSPRFLLLIAFSLLCLQACASTHMKRYVGKDLRYVVLEDGQPEHAMDMPDGTRAFQFRWGGGRAYVPQTTTATGQVKLVGDSVYFSEQKLTSGGFIIDNPGCLITYFAKFDPATKGWIVVGYTYPHRLVC